MGKGVIVKGSKVDNSMVKIRNFKVEKTMEGIDRGKIIIKFEQAPGSMGINPTKNNGTANNHSEIATRQT